MSFFSTNLIFIEFLTGFRIVSLFHKDTLLLAVPDERSSQECPIHAGIPQGSILGSSLFLLYIKDLLDVICNIVIAADNATLYQTEIYLFKVNIRNTRKRFEICSKLTKKYQNDVNNVILVFLLLPLNIFHTFF